MTDERKQTGEVVLPDGRRFACDFEVEFGLKTEAQRHPYGNTCAIETYATRTIESVTLLTAHQLVEIGDGITLDIIERRAARDLMEAFNS